MRLLLLGGTQFVGRAVASAALAGGHEVTLFHRGRTGAELFPEAEHVLGDRDGGLDGLRGRDWDACIDVSGYLPRLVRDSCALLRDAVGHLVFVSTISVYADLAVPRDEDGPLATLDDPTTEEIFAAGNYGGLKVLCEQAVRDTLGERASIVRPGYIVGPHDHTGRFTWWVHRAARGGTDAAAREHPPSRAIRRRPRSRRLPAPRCRLAPRGHLQRDRAASGARHGRRAGGGCTPERG